MNRPLRMTASLLGLLLFCALAGLVLVAGLEDRFIYFPQKALEATPNAYGLEAETLWLDTGGARLHGWWIRGSGRRVLLFFHGNAGNIGHRLERAGLFARELHLDVLLVDYRGYGESSGKPSEAGLYADGGAIYRCAADRGFRPSQIVLFGESLGSAVALETALRHPCAAVILETPFLSIPAMAKTIYPFLPGFVIRTRFDNESKIALLSIPKLIIAAESDEIVPREHALRLFELARPHKQLYVVPGATHNDTYIVGGQQYLDTLKSFLKTPASP
ncbi:MAG TPA: alpha/beta hydrolase [Thermoanaerobaculia bacterium]|nr:alpha/beta hydrolase [Thermoanaerobaculia bacterium]